MSFLSSCCGRKRIRLEDEEALIPQYEDDTALQRKLHAKTHTYQMLRALSQGFMPSNEQLIVNLRLLMASDFLKPENPELSREGRRLTQLCRQWLAEMIDLLRDKNGRDQIQDFIWCLTKARISIDETNLMSHTWKNKLQADASSMYDSFQTIGSLLMTNADFRLFLEDLGLIGRRVLADSAASLSEAARDVADSVVPNTEEAALLTGPGKDNVNPPSVNDLKEESKAVGLVVDKALIKTREDAAESVSDRLSGESKETILARLKKAILKLREKPNYQDSVQTLGILIKHYSQAYSRALTATVDEVQADVHTNDAVGKAIENFWSLLTSFGDAQEWKELVASFRKVSSHAEKNPEFEQLMGDVGDTVEKLLLDPQFFDHANENFEAVTRKAQIYKGNDGTAREDLDAFVNRANRTRQSVEHDKNIQKLRRISSSIAALVFPQGTFNPQLLHDALHVFLPLLIQAIQYIPLPRLEIATPEIDILLENLILEPGQTVNNSSFFPFRFRMETQNNVEIRKARFRTHTSVASLVTLKLDGLTIRADEIGYWMRAHSGLARLTDEGIASFHLDERGLDIHIDVEICRERFEEILTLRDVRVRIHHLNYNLRKSKFAWLAWLLKPFIRPIVRKTLEKELSNAIKQLLHAANRELIFARERLRATRIAEPDSVLKFFKAIIARLTPEEDPDLYTAFGVRPSGNPIFKGRYAPGSLVKLWEQEVLSAKDRVQDFEVGGWRNEIFDPGV